MCQTHGLRYRLGLILLRQRVFRTRKERREGQSRWSDWSAREPWGVAVYHIFIDDKVLYVSVETCSAKISTLLPRHQCRMRRLNWVHLLLSGRMWVHLDLHAGNYDNSKEIDGRARYVEIPAWSDDLPFYFIFYYYYNKTTYLPVHSDNAQARRLRYVVI